MFSAVTPMCPCPKGSVNAPVIISTAVTSPILTPNRAALIICPTRLIFSAPPARTISALPSIICSAPVTTACKPLPHSRLSVSAVDAGGIPAPMAATLDKYMSRGSVCITLPNTDWSILWASTPARAIASIATAMAKSQGGIPDRAPPKSPMAVLTPDVITTSLINHTPILFYWLFYWLFCWLA